MIKIIDKTKCSGCTACSSICPQKCISMSEDKEGFLYPQVNTLKCTNCKLCEKVCPISNEVQELKKEQKAYLIQHADDKIREESTAGGAFTAIAAWVLAKQGVVFGAAYDEMFLVKHQFVENFEELKKFRNSKYVQSNMGDSFIKVKQFLDDGRWVCFSGTPCQIEGLSRFLGKNKYEKLVLVDVVCHGIPSPLIWQKYLQYRGILRTKPDDIRFRDKYYGYKYSTMSIVKEGRVTYHAGSQKDPMLRAFFSDICDRPICYSCPFKKRYRVSDITIWDCFEVHKLNKKMDDDKGTTRMLCHSKKGCLIAEEMDCIKFEVNPEKLVNGVKELVESVPLNPNRDQFFEDACIYSGEKLFEKYFPMTTYVQFLTIARNILLKIGIYNIIKRLKNRLNY